MTQKATLIIPAAGKSSRYPNMKPKWLLTHPSGRLMIDKVLNSVKYKDFNRTIITILKEHCKKHDADIILKQIFGDSIELLILEEQTSSAAETVYETIKQSGIKGQLVIKDSDCLIENSYFPEKNYIVGLTIDSKTSVDRVQQKSFIIKNDDDIIVDILEKEMVSNIICLGIYSVDSDSLYN